MKDKKIFIWLVLILTLILICFFAFKTLKGYLYIKSNSTISGQPLSNLIISIPVKSISKVVNDQEKKDEEKKPEAGNRLKIPSIMVNALIESVGVTPKGDMDIPKGSNNVAWFNLGTRIGNNGSAVIDGHYGVWENGTPAVFNDLKKLKKGDEIYVESSNGSTTIFVVQELRTYKENEDATNIFNSNDGKAHLNLITCGGAWNKALKSYPLRLVIFSDKK